MSCPRSPPSIGRIPPAFLPIGNRRLYTWQVETLRRSLPAARINLPLPADFTIEQGDARALEALGVATIPSPPDLSLGSAIAYALLSTGNIQQPLVILHGDTLLLDYPFERQNAVSGGVTDAYYAWASFTRKRNGAIRINEGAAARNASEDRVLTGGFSFSDTTLFLGCLAQARNNFVGAIALYTEEKDVEVIEEGRWLDFGRLHTYFQSRRRITSERAFNRLENRNDFFLKTSVKRAKLEAERDWFLKLSNDLKVFTPTVLRTTAPRGHGAYLIEYVYAAPLSDLYVFGRLPASVWRTILSGCENFLAATTAYPDPEPSPASWKALYGPKTLQRLDAFCEARELDMDAEWTINSRRTPSLRHITEELSRDIDAPKATDITVVHGDYCFSNILFDFRAQRIKLIDPRGLDAHEAPTIYGDRRYETGKLHHSAIGQYDDILAGYRDVKWARPYKLDLTLPDNEHRAIVRRIFQEMLFAGRTMSQLKAHQISILLFLSMLPLHADDRERQDALLANGLRLYTLLEAAEG